MFEIRLKDLSGLLNKETAEGRERQQLSPDG